MKAVYIELCLLYWLQKLDYLLKRAESNIPIYKKDLPCSPALGNKFRKFRSLSVFVFFVIYLTWSCVSLNLCFTVCFAILKILNVFWHFIDSNSQVRSFKNFRRCIVKMVVMMMIILHFLDSVQCITQMLMMMMVVMIMMMQGSRQSSTEPQWSCWRRWADWAQGQPS